MTEELHVTIKLVPEVNIVSINCTAHAYDYFAVGIVMWIGPSDTSAFAWPLAPWALVHTLASMYLFYCLLISHEFFNEADSTV